MCIRPECLSTFTHVTSASVPILGGRAIPPNFSFASDSFEVSGPLIISSLLSFLFFLSALGSAERASSALFRSSLFERQLLQMQRDQQGDPQFQLPDLTLGSHHFFTYLIL